MDTNKPQDIDELGNNEVPTPPVSSGDSTSSFPSTTQNVPAFDTMSNKNQEATPVSPSTPPLESTPPSEKKKPFGLMLGILLVLILIFLGILFFFIFKKSPDEQQPVQQVPVEDLQPSPTSSITPTPELTEDGVDTINIGSPEASLSPIETDIEQL